MSRNEQLYEIIKFGISGVAGFIVDASLVAILTQAFEQDPIVAQIISFTVAVTVTWFINRHWTFAEHASDKWIHEWTRYVAANSIGAAVNNGVYAILVLTVTSFSETPVLAVAAGSIAGMVFNYTSSKFIAFNSSTKHFV